MKSKQQILFEDQGTNEGATSTASSSDLGSKPRSKGKYVSSVWSFPGNGGDQVYRWYGTLPRPVVEQIFDLYAHQMDPKVLEPFMGLGGVLDVAADRGIRATGIDVNPIACLASSTRLGGQPPESQIIEGVESVVREYNATLASRGSCLLERLSAYEEYEYVRKWFRPDTLTAALSLLSAIASLQDVTLQRIFFTAAAQVIRDVASVDPRCTHHLVTKKKPFLDPASFWRTQVRKVVSALRPTPIDGQVKVRQESIFSLEEHSLDRKPSLAIVHPPYLGVIHYHLIHRLASDLFDFIDRESSPPAFREFDFSHEVIKAGDVSTDSSAKYSTFVSALARKMFPLMASDGRCVVIIGDQRHKGHLRHPFTEFIQEFELQGFKLEENFIWILQNNGGMHVLRRGNYIDHNYILVFHKE